MTPPDTCPGVLRDELTPETLRVLFQRKGNTIWQDDMLELEGNRHASAWAADRARIEALEREIDTGEVEGDIGAHRLHELRAVLRGEEER